MLEQIIDLYDRYVQQVADLEAHRKFGEGLFGSKDGPKNHPCHQKFADDLEELLKEMEKTAPGSAAVTEVLSFIYAAPRRYSPPMSGYWMLIAVQGLTAPLTDKLNRNDAKALLDQYCQDYKRRERLPVQDRVVRLLEGKSVRV